MDKMLGFLFLLALGFVRSLRARQLPLNLQALDYQKLANDVDLKDFGSEKFCVFCEEYAERAQDYLANNKTQAEIIEVLHMSCSQFGPLKKQILSIEPGAFCQKVGICKAIRTSLMMKENRCELCEDTVSDVLSKLRNPDTQMDVIHTLLKACESMDTYAAKCKKTILAYAPLLFANTAQFLERHDVCVAVHACNAPVFSLEKVLSGVEAPAISVS